VNLLFVCSRNRQRSPTAEAVFHGIDGIQARSAGTAADADSPVEADDIAWSDMILVMEPVHRRRLALLFPAGLKDKRVVCLGIPDDYEFMEPALVDLLWQRVPAGVPGLTGHRPA
jgi:predicted protein tyrosine phosphatase